MFVLSFWRIRVTVKIVTGQIDPLTHWPTAEVWPSQRRPHLPSAAQPLSASGGPWHSLRRSPYVCRRPNGSKVNKYRDSKVTMTKGTTQFRAGHCQPQNQCGPTDRSPWQRVRATSGSLAPRRPACSSHLQGETPALITSAARNMGCVFSPGFVIARQIPAVRRLVETQGCVRLRLNILAAQSQHHRPLVGHSNAGHLVTTPGAIDVVSEGERCTVA